MQLRGLLLFLLIGLIFLPGLALAESQHYSAADLTNEVIFRSQDKVFSLTVPAAGYSYLDVYLYPADNSVLPGNLTGSVYSYYLNAPEITDDQSFKISLALDKSNNAGKIVYYLDSKTNQWQFAPLVEQTDSEIIIELKGKNNQLILADASAVTNPWQGQATVASNDNLLSVALPESLTGQSGTIAIQPKAFLGTTSAKKRLSNIYQLDLKSSADTDLNEALKQGKAAACQPILKQSIASTKKNSVSEVKNLQKFLKDTAEFSSVQITGKYDKITAQAVARLQEKYAKEILKPLGLTKGSGEVYQATLKKINQLYCQDLAAKRSFIELSFKYDSLDNRSKAVYYWDASSTAWLPLPSFDDYREQTVTALTKSPSSTFALFEEENQWSGQASWYAFKNGLFAASRDWPKGTRLKVTNQSTGLNRGKTAIVTVNDYGPELWTKRIIDLDKFAFEQIGNLSGGIMPVKIEAVK
ncbi:MAG: hypothetical protein NTZ18_01780 [Candidatus Komeilibacteria bacterium]|nr:hypothetical protein [Candidatus Komeilibacteria bacterium]